MIIVFFSSNQNINKFLFAFSSINTSLNKQQKAGSFFFFLVEKHKKLDRN